MKRFFTLIVLAGFFSIPAAFAKNVKALFIGNSFTDVNNLPLIIKNMALASGDTLLYSASVPGGHTFEAHCTNTTTLSLLAQGGWDFVILQEQSQRPSFSDGQVATQVYPYARKLDSLAHHYSPCAKTVFYMTWGYKNGDATNCPVLPVLCTYQGMDSMLRLRYTIMPADNHAWLSPVGKVWNKLRAQSPSIDLYNPDNMHPSEAGSFAGACSFYALLFGKNPEINTYNYTMTASVAATIKTAARTVVYDSLTSLRQHDPLPMPAFTNTVGGSTATFNNQSQHATGYQWNFGDGSAPATQTNPTHTYGTNGIYTVCLKAFTNCDTVTTCKQVNIGHVGVVGVNGSAIRLYPNPAAKSLVVEGLDAATAYQLYDLTGRLCRSGLLTPAARQVDVQSLQNGIYWLQLHAGSGSLVRLKVVVQH